MCTRANQIFLVTEYLILCFHWRTDYFRNRESIPGPFFRYREFEDSKNWYPGVLGTQERHNTWASGRSHAVKWRRMLVCLCQTCHMLELTAALPAVVPSAHHAYQITRSSATAKSTAHLFA